MFLAASYSCGTRLLVLSYFRWVSVVLLYGISHTNESGAVISLSRAWLSPGISSPLLMRPVREDVPLKQPALTTFIRCALPHHDYSFTASPLNPGAVAVCPVRGMFGFRGNLAWSKFHRTTQTSALWCHVWGACFRSSGRQRSIEVMNAFLFFPVTSLPEHKWATCFWNNWYIAFVSTPLTVHLLWSGVDTCSTIKIQKRVRLCQEIYLPLNEGCVRMCCIWCDWRSVRFTFTCAFMICISFTLLSTFHVDAFDMKNIRAS